MAKEYISGVYTPINPEKCKNIRCEYRSSWELKAFKWIDQNANVLQWSSEKTIIPYFFPVDNKMHKYYVDLWIKIKEGSVISEYLIEIKPKKQTIPPVSSKRKKKSTMLYEQISFARNQAKWEAAKAYCKTKGIKFQILTEEHLGID